LGNIQKRPAAQTAHLFFADTKAKPEKPKELFFANARKNVSCERKTTRIK